MNAQKMLLRGKNPNSPVTLLPDPLRARLSSCDAACYTDYKAAAAKRADAPTGGLSMTNNEMMFFSAMPGVLKLYAALRARLPAVPARWEEAHT